jgi:hypothetical protein
VLTVGWRVSAALESRLRHVRTAHAAPWPDHQGHRLQNPSARGVCHSWVGLQV